MKLSTDKVVLACKVSQAQVSFFKNSYEICCVYVTMAPHYLHFDFKLTSDAKISHIFNSALYLISVLLRNKATTSSTSNRPFFRWFLGVADTNDVIQKIEKTLNNTHTTTQKLTNNSFRNTKKHPFFSCTESPCTW